MRMKSFSKQRTRELKKGLEGYHEGDSLFLSKSIGELNRFFDKKRMTGWIR